MGQMQKSENEKPLEENSGGGEDELRKVSVQPRGREEIHPRTVAQMGASHTFSHSSTIAFSVWPICIATDAFSLV